MTLSKTLPAPTYNWSSARWVITLIMWLDQIKPMLCLQISPAIMIRKVDHTSRRASSRSCVLHTSFISNSL